MVKRSRWEVEGWECTDCGARWVGEGAPCPECEYIDAMTLKTEAPEGNTLCGGHSGRPMEDGANRHVSKVALFKRVLREHGGCLRCLRKWRGRTPKNKTHYHC